MCGSPQMTQVPHVSSFCLDGVGEGVGEGVGARVFGGTMLLVRANIKLRPLQPSRWVTPNSASIELTLLYSTAIARVFSLGVKLMGSEGLLPLLPGFVETQAGPLQPAIESSSSSVWLSK